MKTTKQVMTDWIEYRIRSEYRKHKNIDWALISAIKITSNLQALFPEIFENE